MGTDINGFIECRAWRLNQNDEERWRTAIGLGLLYGNRDYDAFGCLFGVRNYANFEPLAAARGLPANVSPAVRASFDDCSPVFGTSWITWAELKTVDWDEPALAPDDRLHEFRQTGDGLKFVSKSGWSRAFSEATGLAPNPGDELPPWSDGDEWQIGDTLYRAVTMSRRDAVRTGDWEPVFTVMETLAGLHGDDGVRLVVWFDN